MLRFSSVSKRFERGKSPALDAVSFEVGEGRICGLLGHNGAGKSTAIGVILGMVHPDSGEVEIDQTSVIEEREKALRKVGAIFETPVFYEYLSGWRNLQILSAYSGGVSRTLLEETVEWVGLNSRIRDRVGTYSHGMRQRLALAQALLPRPRVLILDEPTDGLDPEGIVEFREQLFELRDRLSLTVLLSSHLLSEVEQVCDEIVILQGGQKVYQGSVGSVESNRVLFLVESENQEATEQVCVDLGGVVCGDRFSFPGETDPVVLLQQLMEKGSRVSRYGIEEESLESLYLNLSRRGEGNEKGEEA
ncbi:MAG: ABC transporter ATP-binding protein [Verrucomicrobiota bacterium]